MSSLAQASLKEQENFTNNIPFVPKQFIFPHSEKIYAKRLDNHLSSCFTNTDSVSPLNHIVLSTKTAKNPLLNRKQHRNYCEKHFTRYSKAKAMGRYLHFNSKKNPKLFLNNKSGEYGLFKEDLAKKYKEDFILTTMLWNEIEKQAKNQGLIGVFFTATVKGDLHPFGIKDTVVREDFDYEVNFKLAYGELQQLHRDIRIQSNRTLGYTPTFFKATEYHRTFMPHSHTVYFVKPEDIDKFLAILKNKIALNSQIGRTDTQVLNKLEDNYAVPYLLKYLTKTAMNMTPQELNIFDGWKRALGIKQLYTNSQTKLPKWVIKKARYYFGETSPAGEPNKNYWANNYDTLYDCILDNVKVVDKVYNMQGNLMRTKIIKEGVNKEKILIERGRTFEISIMDMGDLGLQVYKTAYKTTRLIVRKIGKYTSQIVYNKSHYELIDMAIGAYNNIETPYTKEQELLSFINNYIEGVNYIS